MKLAKKSRERSVSVGIYYKGVKKFRRSSFYGLMKFCSTKPLSLAFIKDLTYFPHNGTTVPKKRRKRKKHKFKNFKRK